MARGSVSPLRSAAFRRYFTAQTISLAGSSLSPVALALAVLNATNSTKALSIVLVCQEVPLIAFLLLGGAFADRWNRRTILFSSNLLAGATQLAVGTLFIVDSQFHLAAVASLEVVNGIAAAFTMPALRGLVAEVAPREALQQANALVSTAKNATKIIGPSLAGILVVGVGGGWALVADGASYVVAALVFLGLRTRSRPRGRSSILGELRDGVSSLRVHRWVSVVIGTSAATNFLLAGGWLVLGPEIARHTVGERAWGFALSARSLGLLVTGIVLYRLTFRHFMRVGQVGAALFGLQLVVLGLGWPVWCLLAVCFLSGAGSSVFGIAWDTSLQEHVPHSSLSRVSALDAFGSTIAVPLGQLLVVPIASLVGTTRLAVIMGVAYVCVSLSALTNRALRGLAHEEHRPAEAHQPGSTP